MADKPVTREEKYLAYLTGDYTSELPKPITRKEKYLYELCLKGMGGEVSPEEIKSAVNEYLEKNPVKPGATTEQAQQIEQNKTDVASLKEDIADKIIALKNIASGENGYREYISMQLSLGKINTSGNVIKDGITCHTSTKIKAYNHDQNTNYAVIFDNSIYKIDILGYKSEADTASVYDTGYVTTSPLSLYLQNIEYVNLNIRRIDGGVIDRAELANIIEKVRLNYFVANELAKRTYVTEAVNVLKEYINNKVDKLEAVSTIINVNPSDNLRKILEGITDSSNEKKYIINIQEGIYDIASYYTEAEWNVENSTFIGLRVPDFVTLVGIGNKENVILTAEDSNKQREYISTLNLQNTCALKNLTIKAKNLRYAVHDDFAKKGQESYERILENCDFYGENLKKVYVYGCGIKEGANYKIKNCKFTTDATNNFSFLIHNNTKWQRCSKVEIENCRFYPVDTSYGIVLSSLGTDTKFTYVTLKGNQMKRLRLNENAPSTFGTGITFKVDGYGNSISDTIQIMNSDDVDYSSYVDLVN